MRADTIIALFMILISALLFSQTGDFPGGAKIFPQVLLTLIIILSAILLVIDIKNGKSVEKVKVSLQSVNWRPYITYSAIVLYVIGISLLGFFVSTVCFMVLMMFYLGVRKISEYVLAVSGIVLFFYLLFVQFLHVPLPHGLIF